VSTDLLGLPTFTFEQGASGGYPIEGEKSQSIDELERERKGDTEGGS
jgi:hypothetical protein